MAEHTILVEGVAEGKRAAIVPPIAHALDGVPLVTVASVDTYVADGAILGFEQVSGRPRMVLNLAQAKQQGVTFQSAVMKLMRIVE